MKNRNIKIVPTERGQGLEPLPTGVGIIGYNKEIHSEDSIEFAYKLPLGAIKRLIKSYYQTLQSIDEADVYMSMTGSYEIRMHPYCYRMIGDIREQLNKHGLNGKKIDDEVFDKYFKADYEKLKRYAKNHSGQGMYGFRLCNDPMCCKPLTITDKITGLFMRLKYEVKSWFWCIRNGVKGVLNSLKAFSS